MYNIPNIRAMLSNGFDAEALKRLCFDVPAFGPVFDELSLGMKKSVIIDCLLEYADRTQQMPTLLHEAEARNPSRFKHHLPYYVEDSKPDLSKPMDNRPATPSAGVAPKAVMLVGILALVILLPLLHVPAGKPRAGDTRIRDRDGMTMVYVPAGLFLMGSSDSDWDAGGDERPEHVVTLDAFWIDRSEVTNAQFHECVEAGACQVPSGCDWGNPTYDDKGKLAHPVVCTNWEEANTYCQWAGARLPTEAEWEKAARGTSDKRTYPWGISAPDCSKAHYAKCGGQTVPVGKRVAGASLYGALDMAGNVWEWVADWWDPSYYASSPSNNPPGPDSGAYKVLRGGSWDHDWTYARAANRYHYNPIARLPDAGFRCATSVTE